MKPNYGWILAECPFCHCETEIVLDEPMEESDSFYAECEGQCEREFLVHCDDIRDNPADSPTVDCPECAGTGEGMYGQTRCGNCRGLGYFKYKERSDDE